jgi:hypothetical protein
LKRKNPTLPASGNGAVKLVRDDNAIMPSRSKPVKAPWRPKYAEDIMELARRLQIPAASLVDILEGSVLAGWNLSLALEEFTGVDHQVWLLGPAGGGDVWLRGLFPVGDAGLPCPVVTTEWAARYWGSGKRMLQAANDVGIEPRLLAYAVYRRLQIREDETADALARVMPEIPSIHWMNNLASGRHAFIGLAEKPTPHVEPARSL